MCLGGTGIPEGVGAIGVGVTEAGGTGVEGMEEEAEETGKAHSALGRNLLEGNTWTKGNRTFPEVVFRML